MNHISLDSLKEIFIRHNAYLVGSRALYESGFEILFKDTDIITNMFPPNLNSYMCNEKYKVRLNKYNGLRFYKNEYGDIDVWIDTPENFINRAKLDGYPNPIVIKL